MPPKKKPAPTVLPEDIPSKAGNAVAMDTKAQAAQMLGLEKKPKGPSLFTLTQDEFSLLEAELAKAEEAGLPYDQAIQQAIQNVEGMTAAKVLGYCALIKNLEHQASLVEAEERLVKAQVEALRARRTTKENKVEALKKRLIELLPKDFKAEDGRAKFSFRAYPKLVILDPSQLPPDCKKPQLTMSKMDGVTVEPQDFKEHFSLAASHLALCGIKLDMMLVPDTEAVKQAVEAAQMEAVQKAAAHDLELSKEQQLEAGKIPGAQLDPNWHCVIK